ncbi:hypothetical protein [Streptacidiphilus cavernicola]|uniref:Sodium:proton antiporter n=1 Tax=Streptacidiphilus cavernicola TaxID=3342716 RepID=A0ABV6VQ42_9ACTN
MPDSHVRAVVELLSWWSLLFALYLVFISAVSVLEVAVGAGAAGLAAVGAWAARRAVRPVVGPAGHCAAALWAWPGTLLAETVRLAVLTAAALGGRVVEGRWRTVRLRPGVGAAWACALMSGTPGGCVVEVEDTGPVPPLVRLHTLFPGRSRLEELLTEEDAG